MGKPLPDWRLELRDGRRAGTGKPLTRLQLATRRLAEHLVREHGNVVGYLPDIQDLRRRHRGGHFPGKDPGHTHEILNPGDDTRMLP